jgi:hypothetical protein
MLYRFVCAYNHFLIHTDFCIIPTHTKGVIVLSSSSKKSPKKKSNKLAPKNINKSTKDAYKSVDLITALFH